MHGVVCLSVSMQGLRCRVFVPERGPRRVLCVVEVTTSAQSKGESTTPPATSPEMCAMSTIMYAPTCWTNIGLATSARRSENALTYGS